MVAGARMTDEIQALKDRVKELEWLLGLHRQWPRLPMKGIRVNGWNLMGLLLRWPLVTHDMAYRALYGGRPESDQPNIHIITTNIHRLRRALEPYGITIRGEYGSGYYLDAENRKKLAGLVGNQEDPDWSGDPVAGGNSDSGGDIRGCTSHGGIDYTATAGAPLGVAADGMASSEHR